MNKHKNGINDIKASSESILKKVIGFIPDTKFENTHKSNEGNSKAEGINKFKLSSCKHLDKYEYAFIKLFASFTTSSKKILLKAR